VTAATGIAPPGLGWRDNGQVTLSGPLQRLATDLDAAFLHLARSWAAVEERHPPTIPAAELHRIEYFESFTHLATFTVALDADEENLEAFSRQPLGDDGVVALRRSRPVTDVLTPAACYHVYVHHQGEALDTPLYVTTRNTCFRQETSYEPLRRQSAFDMREIVAVGTRDEVVRFLGETTALVDRLLVALGLEIEWRVATDPFFQPARNPKYVLQRVQPTKHEAVFAGDLAIASRNLHEQHFGAAFDLQRGDGPAASGCVAFGLERWLYAVVATFGPDPAAWPDPMAAVAQVTQ